MDSNEKEKRTGIHWQTEGAVIANSSKNNLLHQFLYVKSCKSRLKFGDSVLFIREWEINGLVCSRRSYVELRIKHVNARDYPVKPWHGECHMAFVLTSSILAEKVQE